MTRRRSLVLASLVTAACCLAGIALLRGASQNSDPPGLEVVLATPRGEVGAIHAIDVVFNEAMVPLGRRGIASGSSPLEIDPPIRGSFSWLGSSALSFIPKEAIPPGRRLVCRVPKGVRSLSGRVTSIDYVWEIVVGRPQLLASVPKKDGVLAPDEALYFLFSAPPAEGAADSIRLIGPTGPIALSPVAPDSSALAELIPEPGRGITAAHLLVLRPEKLPPREEGYTVEIAAGIPLQGTDVGIAKPISIPFRIYGAPAIRSVRAWYDHIRIRLDGPVDPETLAVYLEIDPSVTPIRVEPAGGTEVLVRSERFRMGASYAIRLREGMPSLLGERLLASQAAKVTFPHAAAQLSIEPSGGFLPDVPDLAIRIEGANVDTVRLSGRWVPARSVPDALQANGRYADMMELPRIGTWIEPSQSPDSARAMLLPVSRLGAPPAGAKLLILAVEGRSLFADKSGERRLHRDRAVLQITNMGVSAFAGEDRGLVWVTSLPDGRPLAQATVRMHDAGQKKTLWSGTTDEEGLVWTPGMEALAISPGVNPVIEARAGTDAAWLAVSKTSPMPRGRGAQPDREEHRAFAQTDRPLYRPGEKVQWVALARALGPVSLEAAKTAALGYRIFGPDGDLVDRGRIDLAAPGQGTGSFTIAADAPVGYYALQLTESPDSENVCGGTSFSVEEYRLPRFQARVETPAGPVVTGEEVSVIGRFTYLNGGALSGAPVRWTISRQSDWSMPPGHWNYTFFDHRLEDADGEWSDDGSRRIAAGEANLDREGRITLPVTPDISHLGQDQIYLVEIGARDLTDRSAYAVGSFNVRRASVRVGARAQFPQESSDGSVELSGVCLDSAGVPVAGAPLRWTIERRDWKTVRIRRIGGVFGYENIARDSVLERGSSISASEPMRMRWKPPRPGNYSFLLEATDAQGRTTRARDDIWVWGVEPAAWYRDDHGWIELKPDQEKYAPGDTAAVLVPAPAIPTEGIVLVMDDGIRSVRRLHRLQGSPRVEIPLDDAVPWGRWVQMVLVGPSSVPQGDAVLRRLPYYGAGRTMLQIRPDDWRVKVDIATDRPVYAPREEVTVLIQLADAGGRPLSGSVSLAVVDDAIFELAGEWNPDPISTFFSPRWPEISYDDVRESLNLPATGEKGRLTPGGDKGADAGFRRRFLPTVHWEPLIAVGEDGRATVRFTLADDLTRYRLRGLASSGVDRFGSGESKTEVRRPLQLEWGAPRFVRDGDEIDVAAVVRAEFDRKTEVKIRATAEGASIDGKREQKVKTSAGEPGRAIFRLRDARGAECKLRLIAEGGGQTDAAEVVIPLDRPLLWKRAFAGGRIDQSARTPIEIDRLALPEQGGLTVTVGPSLLTGLEDALRYTIDYPYGCLEQLSSSLLAMSTRKLLAPYLGEEPGTIGVRPFEEALSGIRACVDPWSIRSWPSSLSAEGSSYTVGYALYCLARAKAVGLEVPDDLIERFANECSERYDRLASAGEEKAGRQRLLYEGPWLLWVRAEYERLNPNIEPTVRVADLEGLISSRRDAPLESRIVAGLVGLDLKERKDAAGFSRSWPTLAKVILEETRESASQRTGRFNWIAASHGRWGDGIGGDVRATALFLRLIASIDPADPEIPGMVGWLLDQRRPQSGAWSNNHTSALALDLLATTVATLEGPPSSVTGTVRVGSSEEEFAFGPGRAAPVRRFAPISALLLPDRSDGSVPLRIETSGQRPVYYQATLDQAWPALDAPPLEDGLIVERSYQSVAGERIDEKIAAGDPIWVHLAVVVPRWSKNLLVEDPLPGGIEALNLRFQNAPRLSMEEVETEDEARESGLWIVHREIRDRSVRLFAEDVEAGVYHVYYPAIATTAGVYRTPGARAEMLYSPEMHATSPPKTIKIERSKR